MDFLVYKTSVNEWYYDGLKILTCNIFYVTKFKVVYSYSYVCGHIRQSMNDMSVTKIELPICIVLFKAPSHHRI